MLLKILRAFYLILLSIFLTVGFSCARKHDQAGMTQPDPLISANNEDSGGAIQGGGGGDFSASAFWDKAAQVKDWLDPANYSNVNARLTSEQMAKVRRLIDPEVTTIEVTEKEIKVTGQDGKPIRVDAVNIPEQTKIILYMPTWKEYFSQGVEVRHLILHEFLGLAKIDDSGYKISKQFYIPFKQNIPFDLVGVNCQVVHRVHINTEQSLTTTEISSQNYRVKFSEPQESGIEIYTHKAHKVRFATVKDVLSLDSFIKVYQIENNIEVKAIINFILADAKLGITGTKSHVESVPPTLTALAKYIMTDQKTGKTQLLAVQEIRLKESTVSYGLGYGNRVEFKFDLHNSQLFNVLLENGIGNESVLSVDNFWKSLTEYSRKNNIAEQHKNIFLMKTIFKDMPQVVPHSAEIHCIASDK